MRGIVEVLPFVLFGVGVGWWVHPGAGLAAAALLIVVDNLLPDSPPAARGERRRSA